MSGRREPGSYRPLEPELLRRIGSETGATEFEFPTVDGRLDLRGYRVEGPPLDAAPRQWTAGGIAFVPTRRVFLEHLNLVNLDLRGSDLTSVRISDSRIDNCRLDGAKFTESGWIRVTVTDSSFDGADLRETVLGSGAKDSLFERVTFRSAAIGRSHLNAHFIDCDFERARLVRSTFEDARLTRCRFAGPLTEVAFKGKRRRLRWEETLEDVDFSEADLHFVEFEHLNLSSVRLPENDRHVMFGNPRCTLDRAIALLKKEATGDQRGHLVLLKRHRERLGPNQERDIFGVADFTKGDETATKRTVDVIRSAEAACRG